MSMSTVPLPQPSETEADRIHDLLKHAKQLAAACREVVAALEDISDPVQMSKTYQHNIKARMWSEDPHCHFCRRWIPYRVSTLDHYIPKSNGGDDSPDNLVLCCRECNKRKGELSAEEFMSLLKEDAPTPAEIEERKREIRKTWTRRERWLRLADRRPFQPWSVPEVSARPRNKRKGGVK
jgi:hypothetical protein